MIVTCPSCGKALEVPVRLNQIDMRHSVAWPRLAHLHIQFAQVEISHYCEPEGAA